MTRPLGFAHRGASADAPANTLAAFRLALQLGAPGLETDVWRTADGVPVLHHGGSVRLRGWGRRRSIGMLTVSELPRALPRLADLYEACGTDFDLSVDLKDRAAGPSVVDVSARAGHDPARLWICGGVTEAAAWRARAPAVRLVASPVPEPVDSARWAERLRELAADRVDAVNLRRRYWSPRRVRSVHEAGLRAFGWDAQSTRRIGGLLALGCDAVYSDHVDRLVAALQRAGALPQAER